MCQVIKYVSFLIGIVSCCFLDASDSIINTPTVVAFVCFATTLIAEAKITIDLSREETNRRIQERRKQIEKIDACDHGNNDYFRKAM